MTRSHANALVLPQAVLRAKSKLMPDERIDRSPTVGISSVDVISGFASLHNNAVSERRLRINRHHVVENLRVGSVDDLKRKNASGTRRNESVIGDVVPCCTFESDAAVRHATNGIVDYCHICCSRSKVNTYGNIATNIRDQ